MSHSEQSTRSEIDPLKPESLNELLTLCLKVLEKAGLNKENIDVAKQAENFVAQNLKIHNLDQLWLDPTDADNLERMFLLLGVADTWQKASLEKKKKLIRLLASIFPPHSRQTISDSTPHPLYSFEKIPQYEAERSAGSAYSSIIVILSYRYHSEIMKHPEFIKNICPNLEDQKRLNSPEGWAEWLYDHHQSLMPAPNASLDERKKAFKDVDELERKILLFFKKFSTISIKDSNDKDVYEWSLEFKRDSPEYGFINGWLQQKKLVNFSMPAAVSGSATSRVPGFIIFYMENIPEKTKEHERFHQIHEGFLTSPLGDGLDEAMTELLAQEKVANQGSWRNRLNYKFQHFFQDKYYLGESRFQYSEPGTIIRTFARDVAKSVLLLNSKITRDQAYDMEVSLLLRLFKKFPNLRAPFENRYKHKTPESVIRCAVETINTIGIEAYLELFLVRPLIDEENKFARLPAKDVAKKL